MGMTLGIISGALAAGSTFLSSQAANQRQAAQASYMESQARVARSQGESELARGRAEAEAIDRRKSRIHGQFNETQGRNRAMLGAGNVDMTSGSAARVAEGNINAFAADLGENQYQKLMKLWEAMENRKVAAYQADVMSSQASWLQRTNGNIGTSILSSALAGASGFASGYTLGGGSLAKLFGIGDSATAATGAATTATGAATTTATATGTAAATGPAATATTTGRATGVATSAQDQEFLKLFRAALGFGK